MKFLEKVSLVLFSIIILIISLVLDLLIFGWIKISDVTYFINLGLIVPAATNTILAVTIVLMLLAIKCIFFSSREKKDSSADGVLLENESGKLLISINTIENLVKGAVREFPNIKSSICKVILDKQENNVKINLNLIVEADTVLKDISVKLQEKIKETVKSTAELDVKEVNIKIKDIEVKKEVESDE